MKYPYHWGVKEQKQGWHVGFMPPLFEMKGNGVQHTAP
jgi:hypothetical protein